MVIFHSYVSLPEGAPHIFPSAPPKKNTMDPVAGVPGGLCLDPRGQEAAGSCQVVFLEVGHGLAMWLWAAA